jgi:hypothetical protein
MAMGSGIVTKQSAETVAGSVRRLRALLDVRLAAIEPLTDALTGGPV